MASSKRAAGRELNHDNWNEEEEVEEAGEFKKASATELENRKRKIAKRKVIVDSESSPGVNAFSGFGGFQGFTASTPANSMPFSFFAKIPSAASKTNGSTDEKSNNQIEYLSKVKALNVAVADWIKTHVDDNPLCVLTPIFQDYEKYMKEFEALKTSAIPKPKETEPKTALTPPSNNFSFGKPSVPTSTPSSSQSQSSNSNSIFNNFKFGGDQQKSAASPPKPTPAPTENRGISFASGFSAVVSEPNAVSPTFSFGLQQPTNSSTSLFGGFTNTTNSFSFANTMAQASKSDAPKTSAEEEADDEPPKNEFVPVVEDDSLYSKRCKVFVKGASEFSDRGIGKLYIKKVEGSKFQLIVRADTNLGNILLNIMIVEGLPVSKFGKNNVMIVCIPTPDAKPPPTSVLIRVKTGEEADELLNTINQYKE